jgi:hypothetical protein
VIKIGVTVNTRGLQRYKDNLNVLEQVVMATAGTIEGEAKLSIRERSSRGNEYIRGGKIHYAAEAGNAPNQDTGKLADSIVHRQLAKTSAEVAVGMEYAIPLEIGWHTENGAFHGPFPFLVPAVQKHAEPFKKAVASVMRGKQP